MTRAHEVLAGTDGPGRRVPPASEFLHPVPLLAAAVMVLNDHVLKQADPGWLTGKLSDFAGLLFIPLLLTATLDTVAWLIAQAGLRNDFSLRRWKLAAAVGITGVVFAATKLIPSAAEMVESALRMIGARATIASDPTDLIALPMLFVAYRLGTADIARVPRGRLEYLERKHDAGLDIAGELSDIVDCGASPELVSELAGNFVDYLQTGDREPVDRALAAMR